MNIVEQLENGNTDPENRYLWNVPSDSYHVITTNDRLWKIPELVGHLVKQQYKELILNLVPEAQCVRSTGLYDLLDQFQFKSVTIYTWNELERHDRYTIVHKTPKLFFAKKIWTGWAERSDDLYHWSGDYVFSAFFGRPTADRLGIASHLYTQHNLLSKIGLAFDPSTDDSRLEFEIEKLFSYDVNCLTNLSKLIPVLPLDVGIYNPPYWYYTNPLIYRYKETFIDMVSEPNIAGNTFFFTEKTVRPMILKRPFIMMAGRDSLCYLRQMGFKTFHDFWDEEYDGYSGKERYTRIIKLIDSIAVRPKQQIHDMYKGMQDVLEYNFQLLETQSFTTEITPL